MSDSPKLFRISLIVAVDQNSIMAKNGSIPWHCKEDLKLFKEKTLSKPVIMGSKTYYSIGKPLVNRMNIVLTTRKGISFHPEVYIASSIDQCLSYCKNYYTGESDEMMVIGGKQVYDEFLKLDLVDRIYLSLVKTETEIDNTCLSFDVPLDRFTAVASRQFNDFTFLVFDKKYV